MMKSIATLISVVLCSFSAWAQTITAAQDPWPPFCDGECAAKRAFGGHCDRRVCYSRLYGGVYYHALVAGAE